MSLTVQLLSTSDDPKTVTKTYTTIDTVTAVPTDSCSLLAPKLLIDNTAIIKDANYMYISEWGRYYFIGDPVFMTGKKIMIPGSVDVLMSWDSSIRNCEGCVLRSESIGRPTMIPDSKLPINPNKKELLTAKKSFTLDTGSNLYLVRVKQSPTKYQEPE